MANIQRLKKPPVVIQLNGAEYTLRYTLGSFAYLEDEFGTVDAAFTAADTGKISPIIKILYAGLKSTHKELTPDDVADLVDIEDLTELIDVILKAVQQDQPQPEAGKK